jgi:tRNA(Ile)-lysidine synthase TilS/MesJ
MNEDTAFRRVRIRKILLPLLADMNPRIIETLANTAALMQRAAGPVQNEDSAQNTPFELELKALVSLDEAELNAAIRSWLKLRRGTMRRLELKHIQAVERLVSSTKSGRTVELPGGTVVKSGGKLVYKENKVEN